VFRSREQRSCQLTPRSGTLEWRWLLGQVSQGAVLWDKLTVTLSGARPGGFDYLDPSPRRGEDLVSPTVLTREMCRRRASTCCLRAPASCR
jgi:hypothetical protein